MRMIEAVYRSAQENRPIKISEVKTVVSAK
jgi:hypothetical protein